VVETDVVVGLDLGTTKSRVIVAARELSGQLKIIGVGVSPSGGLRKGVVVDVERKPSATVTVVPRPSPFPVPRETIPDPIAPSPPRTYENPVPRTPSESSSVTTITSTAVMPEPPVEPAKG